jgi:hypothetical protein
VAPRRGARRLLKEEDEMLRALADLLESSWRVLVSGAGNLLPNVLAALFIVALFVVVGVIAGRVTTWVTRLAKVDRAASRLGLEGPMSRVGVRSVGRLAGKLVQWIVIAAGFIPALSTVDPRLAVDIVRRSLEYLPHLLVGVLIFWIGFLLSRFLGRAVLIAAVNAEIPRARLLAAVTRTAVMLVSAAIAFEQLGVGRATVLTAFAILFGGVTLAASLAVGLGSQHVVRRWWAEQAERRPDGVDCPDRIQHW